MAQRSHVPKFGNWDSDNVTYTTYFENARKGKAGGVRMMNPNDPEENPDAFICIEGGPRSEGGSHEIKPSHHVASDKSMADENHQAEGHMRRNAHRRNPSDLKGGSRKSITSESGSDKSMADENHQAEGHMRRNAHRRNPSDLKGGSRKSITSESGSDKSNSDYSLLQANHRRAKSDRKKSLVESSNSFSPSLAGPTRPKFGNHPPDDNHHRATASVPKFGAWDENDPNSGEGFTVIFNKVKEEKQIASTNFPTVPQQPSNYSNSQKKHGGSSSFGSKLCCCLGSK